MKICFCELTNLTFPIERERYVGNGLSIKKMTRQMCRVIDNYRGYTVAFGQGRWGIYGAQRRDFAGRANSEVHNSMRFLVDALLLCCGQDIQPSAEYLCDWNGGKQMKIYAKSYGGVLDEKELGNKEIAVTNGQIAQIKKVFPLLLGKAQTSFIQVPLTFYREACVPRSRHIPWKAAVYLTVALESLFLSQGSNGKAAPLARRVANFLSSEVRDEDEVYREVFALYKCRNAIVHEGNQWPTITYTEQGTGRQFQYSCNELTQKSYGTVRRCLTQVLTELIVDKQTLVKRIEENSMPPRPILES